MRNCDSIEVIIRTKGASRLLVETVKSIVAQENIQPNIVIVNSGISDQGLRLLADRVTIIPYKSKRYNYSEALNQAIPVLRSEFTLVISSHTCINNPLAVAYGISLLKDFPMAAAANFSEERHGLLSHSSVDLSSFNGWNGTWNTATLYRSCLLKERPFRPEVLSAEDQEWSRWVLEEKRMVIYHIAGCHCTNRNPKRHSLAKKLREWEFISAYAYSPYLSFRFIAAKLRICAVQMARLKISEAIFELLVASVLIRVRLLGTYSTTSSY